MTLKRDHPITAYIGDFVRKARLELELTQEELAIRADISTRYCQSIEAQTKQPTIETIFKLAYALEIDYTEMLDPLWLQWLKE